MGTGALVGESAQHMTHSPTYPESTWRIKAALALNYIVFAMLMNSIGPVILQVQHTFGATKAQASILDACHSAAAILVSILIAAQLPRLGCRRAMLCALGVIAIVCLLMPSLDSFTAFKLLFAATGAGFAVIKMTGMTTIGLITRGEKAHASLMSFLGGFFSAGVFAGYFLFAAFIDEANPSSPAWLNVYYVLAAIAAVAFLLLWSTPLDESGIRAAKPQPLLAGFKEILLLAATTLTAVYGACAFTYVLIEHSIMSWLPTFNANVLHLPTTLSIQFASILAASMTLGRFIAGFVLRRVSWLTVLLTCLGGAALLVTVTLPLASGRAEVPAPTSWLNAPAAAFVFPLVGLLLAPINQVLNSVILTSLPVQRHGTMAGLIMIFTALGGASGAIATAYIFQTYGGQTAFYFSLVPMAALSALLITLRRIQKRRSDESTTPVPLKSAALKYR